ncbi:MAG: cysteine synthase A [Alphaproteobacteria bacterium]
MTYQNLVDAIGNTPLLKLKRASEETGCTILGKAEWMNPGGSVKDRAAKEIIENAEAAGLLKPGATIVEGTAGNTGIGIAHVASAKGYKTLIVIPETQSEEKKNAIRLAGATLKQVPAKPYKDPDNFIHVSERIAKQMNEDNPGSALWANQFDNTANRDAHIKTTGPEIWQQTSGKVDGFVCSVGSGGTLAGMAMYLRSKNPDIKIGLVDPYGANLFNYYTKGELSNEGSSIMEGIGQIRITKNLEGFKPDFAYRATDAEALSSLYQLADEEGMPLGGSSGINLIGAMKLAKDLGPGHTIVTILCDSMGRYMSKIGDKAFMDSKELPTPRWAV